MIMNLLVMRKFVRGSRPAMPASVLSFVVFLSIVSASAGEDIPPPNKPPELLRASATERNGKVVIQITRPRYKAPRKAVSAEAMKWQSLNKVILGESVHAFGVDGKRLKSKVVLRSLQQPAGVAVFVRFYEPLLDPDPFYLEMLREGIVVFVVAADALADPVP